MPSFTQLQNRLKALDLFSDSEESFSDLAEKRRKKQIEVQDASDQEGHGVVILEPGYLEDQVMPKKIVKPLTELTLAPLKSSSHIIGTGSETARPLSMLI